MTVSEPVMDTGGWGMFTESGGQKLSLRKSMCIEHRGHIQTEPLGIYRTGGLLVQLDLGFHHLVCLMWVTWSPRKNSVPSAE